MALLKDLTVDGKGYYGIGASAVDKRDDLYTYLRITDIRDDGTLNMDDLKSVDDPDAGKYLLKPNDIVFARTGASTGRNYFYDGSDGTFVYAGFLIKFSIDPNKVNPLFVKYYCQSAQYRNWISSFSTGSTRGNINAQTLGNMEIPLPTREQQDFLVSVLAPMDAKIKQNTKINDNLQQQAQTLFAEHFCLRGGDSIPDGWSLISLGDVAVISNKSFNPLKQPETMLEHYSIPAFDETRCPVFELSTAIKSNKFVVDEDCFMISKLNPTTKRVWRPYCITENAVCSTEFIVYKAKKRELTDFLYSLIDSASFSDFMCSHVTGSTGSRQRTTPSDTLQYQFYMPTTDEIADFSASVAPMYATIRINALENARLKELRDSLLPRLMSGDIDVSEVSI